MAAPPPAAAPAAGADDSHAGATGSEYASVTAADAMASLPSAGPACACTVLTPGRVSAMVTAGRVPPEPSAAGAAPRTICVSDAAPPSGSLTAHASHPPVSLDESVTTTGVAAEEKSPGGGPAAGGATARCAAADTLNASVAADGRHAPSAPR